MLKKTSAIGPAASIEVDNEKQDGKRIQVENWDEKKLVQKSRKSQQISKSKKSIQAKKSEAFRAKNISSLSRSFLTYKAKKVFTKLRQTFIEAPILNYFDLEHHIKIETDASG